MPDHPLKPMLLFDLDGTLWDSAAPVAESWNQIFQREDPSLPLLTVEDIHGVMGMTMREISETLYRSWQHPLRRPLSGSSSRDGIPTGPGL